MGKIKRFSTDIPELDNGTVHEIKERLRNGEHVGDIADILGLPRYVIGLIKSGRIYEWVE